jgi:hypothetical protein
VSAGFVAIGVWHIDLDACVDEAGVEVEASAVPDAGSEGERSGSIERAGKDRFDFSIADDERGMFESVGRGLVDGGVAECVPGGIDAARAIFGRGGGCRRGVDYASKAEREGEKDEGSSTIHGLRVPEPRSGVNRTGDENKASGLNRRDRTLEGGSTEG